MTCSVLEQMAQLAGVTIDVRLAGQPTEYHEQNFLFSLFLP